MLVWACLARVCEACTGWSIMKTIIQNIRWFWSWIDVCSVNWYLYLYAFSLVYVGSKIRLRNCENKKRTKCNLDQKRSTKFSSDPYIFALYLVFGNIYISVILAQKPGLLLFAGSKYKKHQRHQKFWQCFLVSNNLNNDDFCTIICTRFSVVIYLAIVMKKIYLR